MDNDFLYLKRTNYKEENSRGVDIDRSTLCIRVSYKHITILENIQFFIKGET